jgi:hypothetical protein
MEHEHQFDGILGISYSNLLARGAARRFDRCMQAIRALRAPVAIAAVAFFVLWTRLGAARTIAWAEDSGVFLQECLMLGPIRSLWHPYDGYLHVLPRILVDIALALVPIGEYAVAVAALSVGVTAAVCGLVFALSARALDRTWCRVVIALVPVLIPLAPYEIAGNTANLHWYLLYLAPWVLLAQPRTWWAAGLLAATAAAISVSEIQVAMFLPLFLVPTTGSGGWRPGRRRLLVAAGAALGLVAQTAAFATHPRPGTEGARPGLLDIVVGFLVQPLPALVTTDVGHAGAWALQHGWVPGSVVLATVAALAVVAFVRASPATRVVLFTLVGGAVGTWAAAVIVNADSRMTWASHDAAMLLRIGPLRYAAASSMFLAAAIVVVGDALMRHWARPALRVLRGVGAVCALFPLVVGASELTATETRRSNGPVWSDEVDRARSVCERSPTASLRVDAMPGLPRWGASVPCEVILRGAP